MKRDMDLIRTILLQLEAIPEPELRLTELSVEGHDDAVVFEHLVLLEEAGLIGMTVQRFLSGEPPEFFVDRITWAGHEFLESVRNDDIWAKSKKALMTAGVGFAWPFLQAVLRAKAAEHLGIHL